MTSHDRTDKKEGGGASKAKPYRIVGTAVLVTALALVLLWIKVVRGGQAPGSGRRRLPSGGDP